MAYRIPLNDETKRSLAVCRMRPDDAQCNLAEALKAVPVGQVLVVVEKECYPNFADAIVYEPGDDATPHLVRRYEDAFASRGTGFYHVDAQLVSSTDGRPS